MQDKDLDRLADLIVEKMNKRLTEWEKTPEFKELMKSKDTKTIRVLNTVKVMLITHCNDILMTPIQYASRAIIKQIFLDTQSNKKR